MFQRTILTVSVLSHKLHLIQQGPLRIWQLSPSLQEWGESIYKHRTLIPHCQLGIPLINTIRECRTNSSHNGRGAPLPISLIPPAFGLQIEIQTCHVWIMNYSRHVQSVQGRLTSSLQPHQPFQNKIPYIQKLIMQ